ncbi:uncharacterized protein LOC109604799 isoform X3 [Aethina tumida]|uniref:uncharacterized protein LOC109604799 isoform X3 n=1 Tax=Aethina tumida TaxID=116153 RepID=UPI0021473C3A|nr:uncharacterized protein LOC109604799 isoform X3 [Aethina tumida]
MHEIRPLLNYIDGNYFQPPINQQFAPNFNHWPNNNYQARYKNNMDYNNFVRGSGFCQRGRYWSNKRNRWKPRHHLDDVWNPNYEDDEEVDQNQFGPAGINKLQNRSQWSSSGSNFRGRGRSFLHSFSSQSFQRSTLDLDRRAPTTDIEEQVGVIDETNSEDSIKTDINMKNVSIEKQILPEVPEPMETSFTEHPLSKCNKPIGDKTCDNVKVDQPTRENLNENKFTKDSKSINNNTCESFSRCSQSTRYQISEENKYSNTKICDVTKKHDFVDNSKEKLKVKNCDRTEKTDSSKTSIDDHKNLKTDTIKAKDDSTKNLNSYKGDPRLSSANKNKYFCDKIPMPGSKSNSSENLDLQNTIKMVEDNKRNRDTEKGSSKDSTLKNKSNNIIKSESKHGGNKHKEIGEQKKSDLVMKMDKKVKKHQSKHILNKTESVNDNEKKYSHSTKDKQHKPESEASHANNIGKLISKDNIAKPIIKSDHKVDKKVEFKKEKVKDLKVVIKSIDVNTEKVNKLDTTVHVSQDSKIEHSKQKIVQTSNRESLTDNFIQDKEQTGLITIEKDERSECGKKRPSSTSDISHFSKRNKVSQPEKPEVVDAKKFVGRIPIKRRLNMDGDDQKLEILKNSIDEVHVKVARLHGEEIEKPMSLGNYIGTMSKRTFCEPPQLKTKFLSPRKAMHLFGPDYFEDSEDKNQCKDAEKSLETSAKISKPEVNKLNTLKMSSFKIDKGNSGEKGKKDKQDKKEITRSSADRKSTSKESKPNPEENNNKSNEKLLEKRKRGRPKKQVIEDDVKEDLRAEMVKMQQLLDDQVQARRRVEAQLHKEREEAKKNKLEAERKEEERKRTLEKLLMNTVFPTVSEVCIEETVKDFVTPDPEKHVAVELIHPHPQESYFISDPPDFHGSLVKSQRKLVVPKLETIDLSHDDDIVKKEIDKIKSEECVKSVEPCILYRSDESGNENLECLVTSDFVNPNLVSSPQVSKFLSLVDQLANNATEIACLPNESPTNNTVADESTEKSSVDVAPTNEIQEHRVINYNSIVTPEPSRAIDMTVPQLNVLSEYNYVPSTVNRSTSQIQENTSLNVSSKQQLLSEAREYNNESLPLSPQFSDTIKNPNNFVRVAELRSNDADPLETGLEHLCLNKSITNAVQPDHLYSAESQKLKLGNNLGRTTLNDQPAMQHENENEKDLLYNKIGVSIANFLFIMMTQENSKIFILKKSENKKLCESVSRSMHATLDNLNLQLGQAPNIHNIVMATQKSLQKQFNVKRESVPPLTIYIFLYDMIKSLPNNFACSDWTRCFRETLITTMTCITQHLHLKKNPRENKNSNIGFTSKQRNTLLKMIHKYNASVEFVRSFNRRSRSVIRAPVLSTQVQNNIQTTDIRLQQTSVTSNHNPKMSNMPQFMNSVVENQTFSTQKKVTSPLTFHNFIPPPVYSSQSAITRTNSLTKLNMVQMTKSAALETPPYSPVSQSNPLRLELLRRRHSSSISPSQPHTPEYQDHVYAPILTRNQPVVPTASISQRQLTTLSSGQYTAQSFVYPQVGPRNAQVISQINNPVMLPRYLAPLSSTDQFIHKLQNVVMSVNTPENEGNKEPMVRRRHSTSFTPTHQPNYVEQNVVYTPIWSRNIQSVKDATKETTVGNTDFVGSSSPSQTVPESSSLHSIPSSAPDRVDNTDSFRIRLPLKEPNTTGRRPSMPLLENENNDEHRDTNTVERNIEQQQDEIIDLTWLDDVSDTEIENVCLNIKVETKKEEVDEDDAELMVVGDTLDRSHKTGTPSDSGFSSPEQVRY